MILVKGHVLCVCSWHGESLAKSPCPACGRPPTHRMDAGRLEVLRKVQAQSDVALERTQALRLIEIGVLRRASPRIPPNDDGRHKRLPRRHHALTSIGILVLAVADTLKGAA